MHWQAVEPLVRQTYQQYAKGVHIRLRAGVSIQVQQLRGHVRHGASTRVLGMLAQFHGGAGSPTNLRQAEVAKFRVVIRSQQYYDHGTTRHIISHVRSKPEVLVLRQHRFHIDDNNAIRRLSPLSDFTSQ